MTFARPLAVMLMSAGHASGQTHELSIPPRDGENYKSATFRIWLPEDHRRWEPTRPIRAVLVRQHGCGRNGLDHPDDLQWRALAEKHNAALVGSHFVQDKECADWFDPKNGSERAFLEALATVARKTSRRDLAVAPWAVWGHSGGALWACHMANRHPDRVVAVFARSHALTEFTDKALGVPILFNYGDGEKTGRFQKVHANTQAAFAAYRPKGAPWAVAVDPKSGHDCRNSRKLAIPFFDRMLARRLTQKAGGGFDRNLRPITFTNTEWTGSPETLHVHGPASSGTGRRLSCWLPDESFAKMWQEYCKTGDVRDTTPPPAPTGLRYHHRDGKIMLLWQISGVDPESGVKHYHVYRNGTKIGSSEGLKTKGNPHAYIQIWNYGDEPEPRPIATIYNDPDGKPGDRYEITAESHAGQESAKSQPVTVVEKK